VEQKMTKELVIKFDLRALTVSLAIALLAVVSIKTIGQAKAAANLSGQYGCITNKNFSGFTNWATWQPGSSTTSFTGNNYLMYLDFDAGTIQISAVGATKWGDVGVQGAEIIGVPGTVTVTPTRGMTNTFSVTQTITNSGEGGVTKYYLMAVNSGNTLLLQEAMGLSGSGEPNTGMCNKV
jgi:hypothetical protein